MKLVTNTFSILMISLLSISSMIAQNSIHKHFDYLMDDKEAMHISVTGKMFELINKMELDSDVDDEDARDMARFVKSIRSIEFIASSTMENVNSHFEKGDKALSTSMEELVRITSQDGNFCLYIEEYNGVVSELVGIGEGDSQLFVFSVLGEMPLEDIGQIVNHVNMGQLEKSELKKIDISEVKLYPNPVTSGAQLKVTVPEELQGGVGTVYDERGAVISTYKLSLSDNALNISELTAGKYILAMENNGVSIRKKFIVLE